MRDERDAARITGESARAGSTSRRGPRPLGVGRSGGADGAHADGAAERRQRRRNGCLAQRILRRAGALQPGDGPCSGPSVRSAVNHQLESRSGRSARTVRRERRPAQPVFPTPIRSLARAPMPHVAEGNLTIDRIGKAAIASSMRAIAAAVSAWRRRDRFRECDRLIAFHRRAGGANACAIQ